MSSPKSKKQKSDEEKESWRVKSLEEIREERKKKRKEEETKPSQVIDITMDEDEQRFEGDSESENAEERKRERRPSSGDDRLEDDALNIQPPQRQASKDNKSRRKLDKKKHGHGHRDQDKRHKDKHSRSRDKLRRKSDDKRLLNEGLPNRGRKDRSKERVGGDRPGPSTQVKSDEKRHDRREDNHTEVGRERDRPRHEREQREQREHEQREHEQREHELREHELREHEQREREQEQKRLDRKQIIHERMERHREEMREKEMREKEMREKQKRKERAQKMQITSNKTGGREVVWDDRHRGRDRGGNRLKEFGRQEDVRKRDEAMRYPDRDRRLGPLVDRADRERKLDGKARDSKEGNHPERDRSAHRPTKDGKEDSSKKKDPTKSSAGKSSHDTHDMDEERPISDFELEKEKGDEEEDEEEEGSSEEEEEESEESGDTESSEEEEEEEDEVKEMEAKKLEVEKEEGEASASEESSSEEEEEEEEEEESEEESEEEEEEEEGNESGSEVSIDAEKVEPATAVQSKFDETSPSKDAKEEVKQEGLTKEGVQPQSPPISPVELKPKLPPYFPAISGCRNVEEFVHLNKIEEGTYGVVYRAREKRNNQIVALKRLKMEKEKEGFPITSLREISTLLKAQHVNIVTVREIVVGSNMDKIYIVMDYVEHDLKSLMETMKQPFTIGETKCLMQQLLRGVHHLHDNWILHRDLKTSNLLLSHKGILKIGDFGLAREYGSPLKQYTPIVVTLWYRAPELLLGTKEYSVQIDMWSVGCIFAEFLTMKPLFPGKSEIDQLNKIFKELGTPSEKIWPGYNELPAVKKMSFAEHPYNNLRSRFGTYLTDLGFDLLNKFLTYNPTRRCSAEKGLDHEYFSESPLPIDESMFPTWPAKSEQSRTTKRSPKPPEGGLNFAKLGDEEGDGGFRLTLPSHGSAAVGPGFNLRF